MHDRPLEPPWWGHGLRRMLTQAFDRTGRVRFDVKVRGIEHFTNSPRTLIVSNHKSDYDLILLAPLLYGAGGGQGPISRLAFVAAEEMYQPGYVATYLMRQYNAPQWMRRLLFPANLSAVLQALRAYPVPRSGARQLNILLHEARRCFGDIHLNRILRHDVAYYLPGLNSTARISDALQWRYHRALNTCYTLNILQPAATSMLRKQEVEETRACLGCFARILNDGDSLFVAPEGALSHDGGFQPIKATPRRLPRLVNGELTVLPVNITYDWTTAPRPTAFIAIGLELKVQGEQAARSLNTTLERVIPSLTTLTLPQLVARYAGAADGNEHGGVTETELKQAVRMAARDWAARDWYIDPRLAAKTSFERHWYTFMTHCNQHGALHWTDGNRVRLNHQRLGAHPGRDGFWRYHAAELHAALNARQKQ